MDRYRRRGVQEARRCGDLGRADGNAQARPQRDQGPCPQRGDQPDGTRIITGGGAPDRHLRSGLLRPRIAVIVIEPDGHGPGKLKVTPDAGEATLWDARTGEALLELKGLKETVGSVAFSPDGERIVTAGYRDGNRGGAELKVWDAKTGTLLLDLTQPVPDPRGTRFGERGGSVAFSPDGARFVAGGVRNNGVGTKVKVWDARTGEVLVELKGTTDAVLSVAFSEDGKRIATGNYSKTATVWDAETGTALVELKGHTGNVNSVAFRSDGKRIGTGGGDRKGRVWDARTGTTLAELKGHIGAVTSVSFSADGSQILTAGHGTAGKLGEVFVWDAPMRTHEVELMGHTGEIHAVAFSPDGTRIATASQDKTVKVWEARTGSPLLELQGFKGA